MPLLRPATVNHVWWASDDPPGGPLLRELTDIADQVIADSLRLDIPPARHYALADLGWSRSAAWREALAQVFDSKDAAAVLGRVEQLKIWSGGKNDRAARLYAAWVASTLGWKDFGAVTLSREIASASTAICAAWSSRAGRQLCAEGQRQEMVRVAAQIWPGQPQDLDDGAEHDPGRGPGPGDGPP